MEAPSLHCMFVKLFLFLQVEEQASNLRQNIEELSSKSEEMSKLNELMVEKNHTLATLQKQMEEEAENHKTEVSELEDKTTVIIKSLESDNLDLKRNYEGTVQKLVDTEESNTKVVQQLSEELSGKTNTINCLELEMKRVNSELESSRRQFEKNLEEQRRREEERINNKTKELTEKCETVQTLTRDLQLVSSECELKKQECAEVNAVLCNVKQKVRVVSVSYVER